MNPRINLRCGLILALAPVLGAAHSAPAWGPRLSDGDRSFLASAAEPGLADLRAGGVARPAALSAAEREVLRAAEARAPALGDLRGGHVNLSDHDLMVILIAVAVVLIIVIIA